MTTKQAHSNKSQSMTASTLTAKEIEVLLHLELQKSSQFCEEITKELHEIESIVDTYEIYKAKGSDKHSFSNYLQHHAYRDGRQSKVEQVPERRSSTKKIQQIPVVTTNFMNTSAVLSKLRRLDLI
jgi:hypothetical protein